MIYIKYQIILVQLVESVFKFYLIRFLLAEKLFQAFR